MSMPGRSGDRAARQAQRPIAPGHRSQASVRRRAGVFRRALRREASRLRDRRRVLAMALLVLLGSIAVAGLVARGEAAGGDARAYWAGVRIWLNGGDPYHPTGPFMPYVYAPWMLPLFTPWALLPWDVAWFVWRSILVLLLLWSIHWAYKQRPLTTALILVPLCLPFMANLDTGNVTLALTFLLWAAQFEGPRTSGLFWAVATSMKWAPAPFLLLLAPRARAWGLGFLTIALLLSLATLPATLSQIEVVLSFPRPLRLDYLVFLWAAVPWAYRHPEAFSWTRRSSWPKLARQLRVSAERLRRAPSEQARAPLVVQEVRTRVRSFFGLGA